MGDFLLDFRDAADRRQTSSRAASLLKFTDDTRIQTIERDSFLLVLTSVDDAGLWGPSESRSLDGTILVALAGRVALGEEEWDEARKVEGPGGLACKAISAKYRKGGLSALTALNGNFVVLIHDERKRKFFLITDRCGMLLAYSRGTASKSLVFGSHPDALAAIAGESQQLDLASVAEFLMTSRLSFPYTYYKNIRALDTASIFTLDLQHGPAVYDSQTRYFELAFNIDPDADEDELAERLSNALKNAVRRRTLPLFGCTGIGLSGGLDSRAILSAVDPRAKTRAFSLFDEENAEFSTAKAIADACRIEMIPIKRDFDYYANSAELGVRVSGGTGCISCNHFLGARDRLREAGITNILTGCYCDYLFKGLAFNRREHLFSRSEDLNGFQFEFYDSFHWLETPWREEVMARLKAQFPESAMPRLSETDWLDVERKRTFPLAYEQDLAQRVIPQRLMPWFVPSVDNDLLDVYLSIPPRFKLNASVFRKMLPLICRPEICFIPDNNTGSRLNASWPGYALARCSSALRNRFTEGFQSGMATLGSWPNWRYYLCHSKKIDALWNRPNKAARELFLSILGKDPYRKDIRDYASEDLVFFQRLVTQKLWLDQRAL
jgi:asparagine synthase (glutamine-hydrolysing)